MKTKKDLLILLKSINKGKPLNMKVITLFCVFLFIHVLGYSQVSKELPFIEYLIAKEEYDAAITLLHSYSLSKETQSQGLVDSINYLKGWSLYSLKQLDESVKYLKQVSSDSYFYSKSQLFASYNRAHLKDYTDAMDVLDCFIPKDKQDSIIRNYMKSGIFLLNRDFANYSLYQNKLDKQFYGIKKENLLINSIANELATHKTKSTTVAAILSSIILEAVKFISGKRGREFLPY